MKFGSILNNSKYFNYFKLKRNIFQLFFQVFLNKNLKCFFFF